MCTATLTQCFVGITKCELAFGGHEESISQGFFLKLVISMRMHVPSVEKLHSLLPKNGKYLSPDIQNDVIQCCSDAVIDHIKSVLAQSQFYALIADECRDVSKREMLSIIPRYVCRGAVYERCDQLIELDGLDAKGITAKITSVIAS